MDSGTAPAALPLHGTTVIEVGVFMAAPFAAMQLADLGARVIKVEPPAGDPTRATGPFVDGESSPFLRLNRNKESVVLDLKSDAGVAAFRALARGADVVLENLRPGAMGRLGLGPEELWRDNPGLVYASGSGWGQDGPLADRPGLDIMAQARSGLMAVTGTPESGPVKAGVPVCDLTCGLYLALGVLAALRHRDAGGGGQRVDVSLLEAGLSYTIWEAGKFFGGAEAGGRTGSAHQSQAPYQALRARDGWVTAGAITPATWTGFCRALDRPDLLADERYATSADRFALREELIADIERTTAERDVRELVEAWTAHGVPCAPILEPREALTDPQVTERDFIWSARDPELGEVRQLGSPMRLSGTPARRDSPGPRLGAHTGAVLREFGAVDHTEGHRGTEGRKKRMAGETTEARTAPEEHGAAPDTDLIVSAEDGVLTVTFDRPDARNAMTSQMYEGLFQACERADADPEVKALVLRGAGAKAFVAGSDIREFEAFSSGEDGVAYEARISRVINRIEDVDVPTVAVVRGYCVGGGLAIATACDLRLADETARFGVPIARTLGNCLSANTMSLLHQRLGPARTLDLLLRADFLDAEDARAAGFVSAVTAPEDLEEKVADTLRRILSQAPITMWAAKELTRRLRRSGLPDDGDVVERAFGSADFAAAVRAFGTGSTPEWTGR
ncbi:enoyl-CoA hydratase [Nocardiopsis composta]|uniref:Crotonobetainyl-CoA:carnitine CoA-transferase CaiB-like acyl-CoA transferase/enoyl-CoA hydratase/carnithine racemase n=1 Tax=Nocardiopsis composta TaxID=157465 RepID=A0A7W8QRU9_9ACTN|nr:enoyl-CoA hydratase [Nocardiopsis composta]MBB5435457.1 crotonobetainyl-CoA:carnitine CoA-transferase CaiB-like acyl-CoA transferase/enoyl-CoA hydratase/carnithine racemase [Nocardiopsis composta]